MSIMSFVFFGLMLFPLVLFLIWLIKKDKKRDYLGLLVLVAMAIVAIYAIVKFDSNFMESNPAVNGKSQSPSYR
ncbi:thiol:disulfide interchange protein [Pedobacter sp. UYP24]